MSAPNAAEFSRFFDVQRLGADRQEVILTADSEERAALARRFDLLALDHLEAVLTVERRPGRVIWVHGRLRAAPSQACVVSLDPVPAELDEPIELLFSEEPATVEQEAVDLDADEAFWPEPVTGGRIDLGEAVAQQFALALDPYPRAPGAELDPAASEAGVDGGERQRPFRDLARRMGVGRTQ